MVRRCEWAGTDEKMIAYHDNDWGVPDDDDNKLFEMLVLESAQAGLSWRTILHRREHYREVFAGFDPEKVAAFTEENIDDMLQDERIIRNQRKIRAAVTNASCFLEIQKTFGSFSDYVWQFVDGQPIVNHWRTHADVPAKTAQSEALSKDLKKRGFTFVGPTICYAFMQSVGMVNDHTMDCFLYKG